MKTERLRGVVGGGYLQATAAVAAATLASWLMFPYFEAANLIMAYLLAVVGIAARYGHGPSVVAAVLGVAAFDFFFVPPYLTFAVADTQYVLTFAVMLGVGLVISGLTIRIRRQAEAARHRERQTAALYAMSRELAQTERVDDLVAIATRHIGAVFDANVALLLPDRDGRLAAGSDAEPPIVRSVFEQGVPADVGPSSARGLCLPLLGQRGVLGVVTIRPRRLGAFAAPEPRRQLETLVNQTALALERARLAAEAQDARVRAETERLRNSLLTSVSHDLRTPLAAITGAATTILDAGGRLDERTKHDLLESVRDEAERLNRLVQNLLEMTKLESGALQLRKDWHPLEEVIGAALSRLGKRLVGRRVTTRVPPNLPLVAIDDVLIEQVLVNLLDNALKYTPAGSPIDIIATGTDRAVTVEIADRGPGLPPGEEDKVFEKFYRGRSAGDRGAGLGLAICLGVVRAHGGRIWAQNLPGGGAAFLFNLPLTEAPPAAVPADA